MCELRVRFKRLPTNAMMGVDSQNELVMRVQPDESLYMITSAKERLTLTITLSLTLTLTFSPSPSPSPNPNPHPHPNPNPNPTPPPRSRTSRRSKCASPS